ncbi:4-hydroxy-3-methylbut-2-enyl diphosphate reductase [Sunxiuqinia sp. A32]|uniref:4-hydroxy-3-methylbut-2-enyl diphosphate reductase n=1 Tax=Sunxiuqinia sp. A32 TaxID=3461496 RepID=UPI0040452103
MKVTIDQKSGFCFGVVNAIQKAEITLKNEEELFCLGDIVHNGMEVERLESLGLVTIDRNKFFTLKNCKVLLRAHGEPPSTYEYAKENNIELIDATCPVVLKLQQRVKKAYQELQPEEGQIILYGKPGHAEVVGLSGQTNDEAIVIENEDDLQKIDPDKTSYFFAQTTKSIDKFNQFGKILKKKVSKKLVVKDTICRQVSNRVPRLKIFSTEHEVILFVGGKKSSNAKFLFEVCQQINKNSYFVSNLEEINSEWFEGKESVGICGATSTPQWLMEKVAAYLRAI